MAPFNKYISATNDPTYIGYSKGPEDVKPNLALGKLFHGLSDTLEGGLKGGTDLLDIKIEKEVQSKLKANQDESGANITLDDAAALGKLKNKLEGGSLGGSSALGGARNAQGSSPMSYSEEGATLLPEATQNAPVTPPVVQEGVSRLDRLTELYNSGRLSPTYYLTQQQVISQQLKQRFPGSEKEIDQAVHRETSSANQIRAQVFSDFQAAAAAARSHEDKWITEAKGYEKELGAEGMQRAQQALNNPQQQWAIRQEVAGIRKREHDRSVAAADLEFKTAQGKSNAHDFEQAGTQIATNIVAGAASGTLFGASNMGVQSIQESINKLNAATQKDPAVKAALSARLQEVTTFTQQQIYNELYSNTRDDPDNPGKKTSIASKIGSKRANDLMNEVMDPILQARKFLDGEAPSLAANHLQILKMGETNQALKTVAVPYFKMYQGISTVAGPQVAGQLMELENKNTNGKNLSEGLEALKQIQQGTTVLEGSGNLNTHLDQMKQVAPNASKEEKAQFLQQKIKFFQDVFRDPKTPLESKVNAAKELSSEDNQAFVRAFNPREQIDVWSQIAAPDISGKMKELSNTNPVLWDRYKNWNTDTFKVLFQEHIDHLQNKITSGTVLNVQYDDKNNQIVFGTQPSRQGLGGRPVSNFPIGREDIGKLNSGLRTLNGVLSQDKESGKIPQILKEMNFKAGQDKRSSLGEQILAAVDNPLSKQAQGKETPSVQRMSYSPEGLGLSQEQQASVIGVANKAKPGLEWGVPGSSGFVTNNLTNVQTTSGQNVKVNQVSAQAFQGFLNDLEATGYKIKDIGGYSLRNKKGGGGLSQHAFGNAIDINPDQNPYSRKFITDLPSNVSSLAAKWGLSWGGDWKSIKDTMHFEYTGVNKQRRAFEDIDNKDTGILDKLRTDLKINPQAWDAWLAQGPWSSNIEDRRGETPESALAQEILRKTRKMGQGGPL